jgi:hypothetical protein
MAVLRLPGEGALQRSVSAVLVFAVLLVTLSAVASLCNRIVATGHPGLTPNPRPAVASHEDEP